MVPVLSSSRVLTSPAASTARPDIASTLTRTRRSMPAMPMAESRAPMVVGMRQTSSATSTTTSCGAPAYVAIGASVATAARKTSVRLASRIDRAISLGVLRREVPSTSAIILSRKVSPAAAVMRTTMRSDSTRVPPVTALRSPPASRMTGADSPVMADSSTDAMPSTMSPSPGIDLARLDDHVVADLQLGGGHLGLGRRRRPAVARRCRCGWRGARRPVPCRGPRRPPRRGCRRGP